jgi:DMSO reductase anchor subunit
MFKKLLLLGLVSGLLAGVLAWVYSRVYSHYLGVDFSTIATPVKMIVASVIGGLVAALGFAFLHRMLGVKTDAVFNLIFTVLSFASILGPIATKLPLELQSPELFPWLVMPMHLFPVLGWLTLKPLFFPPKA